MSTDKVAECAPQERRQPSHLSMERLQDLHVLVVWSCRPSRHMDMHSSSHHHHALKNLVRKVLHIAGAVDVARTPAVQS